MTRVLSGMQPSGNPHLGNYLGAMKQHIEMQKGNECFYFLADYHALTTVRDPEVLRTLTLELAIDYLSLGIDPEKTVFFKQSEVPEHAELAWILSTHTPHGLLERAHAWKDALAKGKKDPTAGLFSYPVLMAADILLYDADKVPVGKDQKQHIEITRDIAEKFNHNYGDVFVVPEPDIKEDVETIIGVDGVHKMSKSYGNTIEVFASEDDLKKQIFSVVTDSTPLEDPKDPEKDMIYYFYKYIASQDEAADLALKYQNGGFGYGDAKKLLLDKTLSYFADARKKRVELQNNLDYVNEVLEKGATRAREVASKTLDRVREKVGLR